MTLDTYHMTIAGAPVAEQAVLDVINPATGSVFAQAPDCSPEQLEAAIGAARQAFGPWSLTHLDERRALLVQLSDAIEEQTERVATLLTMEQGKPIDDARREVAALVRLLRAQSTFELPVHVAEENDIRRVETRRVPIGVVGAIAPWNFPLLLAGFKIGPALLAGNTVVLKPSPFTPLATLLVGEIARAILPAGVLNVISGGDALGPLLTAHRGIDKISFTGSTETGRRVMRSAADTLKRVTLELGGNDVAIVLDDVDVEATAEKLFWSAFSNNGQICVATKRLYVHDSIYDAFAEAIVRYAKTIKVGNGLDEGVRIGPINNAAQYERIRAIVSDCRDNGYRLLTGGGQPDGPGYFLPVTIVDNPPEDSVVVRDEQFGPVLPLLRFSDEDDVVARANDCDYGLAGSIWSGDTDRATALAERIATGTIFINHLQYLSPFAAFGGQRQSGIGVENGVEGLLEYTYAKTFVTALQ